MTEKIAPPDRIQQAIRIYQGQKVLLDFDLASLYEVTTGALNRQVKRNRDRFPLDFVYEIDAQDVARLICQNGISKSRRGGRRKPVLAFTQEGVAMLSSVLHSERAVRVNNDTLDLFEFQSSQSNCYGENE